MMLYSLVDRVFLGQERRNVQLSRALGRIPKLAGRKGGTHSLSDWAYTIGLFHAILSYTLGDREKVDLLDVGCGTGRLALASQLLLGRDGTYTGIDVNEKDIAFCRKQYSDPRFKFVHLDHHNRAYAKSQKTSFIRYPFHDASFDVATALSVWTHLNEADAIFYLGEIARILRPGGRAIITFFLLDGGYEAFRSTEPASVSAYTFRRPDRYKFDQPVDGSTAWMCPSWAPVPESAIGVTDEGMYRLEQASGMKMIERRHGYWREKPGLFFQDIVILEKPTGS